ncbi:MAG: LysR family transcriptional regulator [Chloroflexi bacterium]|nr:LysR family transcriptional regulator [Chloroflexota bacterium]
MELRELRSFCAAAKLRSISKAAEQLGIGQPTMTTHVKKLEDELGVQLFDRVKRPIQLTLAGARLADLASPLLDGIESLVAMTAQAEAQGPIRIASTHEIIAYSLLKVIKVFQAEYPHVLIRLRGASQAEVLQRVEEGEADFGVIPAPHRRASLDFHGLFPYERVLITPKGHPLLETSLASIDQIAQYPLVLLGQGSSTRAMLEDAFRRRGVQYEIVVEVDSLETIKRCVSLGLGISAGPRLGIEPQDQEHLGIVSLATLLPVEQAGIVTQKGRALSTPARNFLDLASDMIAAPGQKDGHQTEACSPEISSSEDGPMLNGDVLHKIEDGLSRVRQTRSRQRS